MRDLEDDMVNGRRVKECPKCGHRTHEMSSPTYNQTRCPSCGYRGDTREFLPDDTDYDPWLPLERG